MAKELPYFKFEPSEWENGNIQMLSREEKGLFIDLCAIYWSRLGDVPFKLAVQKLCGGNANAFNSLCDEQIIEVKDDMICIHFLNEQLVEFEDTSEQNRQNALKGWEKRREKKKSDRKATASKPQSESNAIREEKRREKKIKEDIKEIVFFPNDILLNEKYKEFLNFRKEIKKKVAPSSIEANKKKLMKLANEDPNKAVEIIEQSIANGWQGFFELKTVSNGGQQRNYQNQPQKIAGLKIPDDYTPDRY